MSDNITVIDKMNDWEADLPMTEKEKKEYTRQRITSEVFDGNPNIPKKKTRKLTFKSPTEAELSVMKYLDYLGNPIKGFKWLEQKDGTRIIVEDRTPTKTEKTKTISIHITKFKD